MHSIAVVSPKDDLRFYILSSLLKSGYTNVLCYKSIEGFNYAINPGCSFDVVIHDISGVNFDEFICNKMGFKQIVVRDRIDGILKYADASILRSTIRSNPDFLAYIIEAMFGVSVYDNDAKPKEFYSNSNAEYTVLH